MYEAKVLRLMIAAPSDVVEELTVIREEVLEWNSIHSEDRSVVLVPVSWETHARPEMGGRPQGLINRQVLAGCDCLVAVFWTRIGTPTGVSISGTVEEIEEHTKAGRAAMVYFSDVKARPGDVVGAQYEELQKFRSECRRLGIIETYESIDEFRRKFSRQLAQMVLDVEGDGMESMIDPNIREESADPVEQVLVSLTSEAGELLVRASLAGDGVVMSIKTFGGLAIQAGGRILTEQGNPRSEARWEAALDCLVELDLLRDYGHKGELFRLTDLGYRVAEKIAPTTTQRRVWMEINGGEDARGSRIEDDEARTAIGRHGGVRVGAGYRFPDGSVLLTRQGRIVASPDGGDR